MIAEVGEQLPTTSGPHAPSFQAAPRRVRRRPLTGLGIGRRGPGAAARSAQPAGGLDRIGHARAGDGQAPHGVGRQRPCRRSRARDAACRRIGHRCGHRDAARSQHRRAAVERHRRRRLHSLLGQGEGRAESLRRPRNGAGLGSSRPLSRRRQADALQRRGAIRPQHRRSRPRAAAGGRTQAARQAAVGQAVRAGHPHRRQRLRDFAAPALPVASRWPGQLRAGGAALFLHRRRQRAAHGAPAEESGVCRDPAGHRGGWRRRVL